MYNTVLSSVSYTDWSEIFNKIKTWKFCKIMVVKTSLAQRTIVLGLIKKEVKILLVTRSYCLLRNNVLKVTPLFWFFGPRLTFPPFLPLSSPSLYFLLYCRNWDRFFLRGPWPQVRGWILFQDSLDVPDSQ